MPFKFLPGSLSSEYDVDPVSGFMPPNSPISRLPATWDAWEETLQSALQYKLLVGDHDGLTDDDKARSEAWRNSLQEMPELPTEGIFASAEISRRAHLVLTCLLAFYTQTMPPESSIIIPRTLSIPLLRISKILDLPPILTYSDTVLYNWDSRVAPPTLDSVHPLPLFSGSRDEIEFYLASARIELRGAEGLDIIVNIMTQMSLNDASATAEISAGLDRLAIVIDDLRKLLMSIRDGCNPDGYYNHIRPWFRGQDSDNNKRKWVFEGIGEAPDLEEPKELSGPSAGQSSIIHVLDAFLGVNTRAQSDSGKPSFMSRMRVYMPAKHRTFLDYLATSPHPLRQHVLESDNADLQTAFDTAVQALKVFRDSHLIIVTLYIVGPARNAKNKGGSNTERRPLKGTGGSELMSFLKELRSITFDTLLSRMPRVTTSS